MMRPAGGMPCAYRSGFPAVPLSLILRRPLQAVVSKDEALAPLPPRITSQPST